MSETTLGALAQSGVLSLGDGYRTKQSELTDDGFRIIRVADVKDGRIALDSPDFVSADFERQIGAKRATAGDVLLTTKGTVGRVAIVPESVTQAVYSPQLCWFRVADSGVLNPRFLAYWLRSDAFLAQSSYMQGNTDMAPYISLSDLRSSKITLPPPREQQAIAEVLGALDDKIAANTSLAATARELGVAMLRIEASTTALGNVVLHHKRQINPAIMGNDVVEHYSLPAFDGGSGPEIVTPNSIKSNKFAVDTSAVLVSKLNPQTPRVWPIEAGDAAPRLASTEFLVLEPFVTSPWVMWALLSQPSFTTVLQGLVAGTSGSHQRVRPEEVLATPILDPRSVQPQLLADVREILAPIDVLLRENRTLAATRNALLPRLVSGKVRVRDLGHATSRVEA